MAGSVGKGARMANKHEDTVPCFPFRDNKSPRSIVISTIQCQNIYLPIADKDRIEGKFAVGVIFRCVFDLQDLPLACICPSNTEGGVGK